MGRIPYANIYLLQIIMLGSMRRKILRSNYCFFISNWFIYELNMNSGINIRQLGFILQWHWGLQVIISVSRGIHLPFTKRSSVRSRVEQTFWLVWPISIADIAVMCHPSYYLHFDSSELQNGFVAAKWYHLSTGHIGCIAKGSLRTEFNYYHIQSNHLYSI